eukprot:8711292-Alexandrium_andersonii.AAC.1
MRRAPLSGGGRRKSRTVARRLRHSDLHCGGRLRGSADSELGRGPCGPSGELDAATSRAGLWGPGQC